MMIRKGASNLVLVNLQRRVVTGFRQHETVAFGVKLESQPDLWDPSGVGSASVEFCWDGTIKNTLGPADR